MCKACALSFDVNQEATKGQPKSNRSWEATDGFWRTKYHNPLNSLPPPPKAGGFHGRVTHGRRLWGVATSWTAAFESSSPPLTCVGSSPLLLAYKYHTPSH
ncbi:unnamed protein product [Rhodiola kirilowii]